MPSRPKPRTPSTDIVLSTLRTVAMPGMTRDRGGNLAQACSVCLDDQKHPVVCRLSVVGRFEGTLSVRRLPVTLQMRLTFGFESRVTEEGASCLAILLLLHHTGRRVAWESKGFNGYDYFLGDDPTFPFRGGARMEVSGIRNGTDYQIASRVKEKSDRFHGYGHLATVYIVVVEFSRPEVRVIELWSTPEN
jgi:hypothetical protein